MEIATLLNLCVQQGASDLHLSPEQPPMIRLHGELVPIDNVSVLDSMTIKNLIYSVMDPMQQKEFEAEFELDFAIVLNSSNRFRVNVFRQNTGVAAVFRVISENIPSLDELGMPAIFKQLLDLRDGLILIAGPSGSGKTTTLAAMVNYINLNKTAHVITIEDPIEFVHQSKKSLINQRQVGRDTHSFNAALRSALREDPDVILLGEMRDLETIRLALTAAETGHLVLATIHTSSAPHAVNRIVDVFSAGEKNIIRNILSEALQAVVYQSLVRKTSVGRVPAFEIMLGNTAIRNLIREDKIAQMYSVIQTSVDIGMCTLDYSLQNLVMHNVVDQSAAREIASNKDLFK